MECDRDSDFFRRCAPIDIGLFVPRRILIVFLSENGRKIKKSYVMHVSKKKGEIIHFDVPCQSIGRARELRLIARIDRARSHREGRGAVHLPLLEWFLTENNYYNTRSN
jgi:hypothetical protein